MIGQNKNSVAFFDFCETLADFQTADAFVDFVREKSDNRRMNRWEKIQTIMKRYKLMSVVERIVGRDKSIRKRIKLWQLRGFSEAEIRLFSREYYQERIKPHLIPRMLEELQLCKQNGYRVGLVSGGYDVYLEHFVEEFGLDFCYCSRIGFRNSVCSGRIVGVDCMHQNKITLLSMDFHSSPSRSLAYSDSETDLPLLSWVNQGVVVSRNQHQKWVEKYNLKEIIWEG